MLINNIKQKIIAATVISFDIFDTLLLRPYVDPNDLLTHLGNLYRVPNFRQIRLWAFDAARKHCCIGEIDEVTLDDIYNFVPEEYKFLKEKELELEEQVLQPNLEIQEVWNYARSKGKKIIIISTCIYQKIF